MPHLWSSLVGRRRRLAAVLGAGSLLVVPLAALNAQHPRSVHPVPPPVATAAQLPGRITIDGRLDERAWLAATPITHFTQTQPTEGAPATQRTEIRFLYDDDALYIGARMYDTLGAAGVRTRLARRDEELDVSSGGSITSDKLTVTLDSYHDHLSRAEFEVNPSGVKGDALGEGLSGLDPSWDPVWDEATQIDSAGWTAEIRIPYSQLHFSRDSVQTWGLEVVRVVDRLNERDQWAFWRRTESGGPAWYGHLTGLVIRNRPRQLELLPYAVSELSYAAPASGDPLNAHQTMHYRFGGDVKYRLTSNLTLDGTVNPDFGQVEVDPAVVNLSAFETFFPEKRPFFVAGSGAFDFGYFSCMFCSNVSSLSLFYSRRIGRPPQLADYVSGTAQYANIPQNSTILGAAKITGRTQGGYTVGLMDAVTNSETAQFTTPGTAALRRQKVEPLSNYFVGRLKRDFDGGKTVIGGMVTSTLHHLDDPILADTLHRNAEAAGLDFLTTWKARTYSLMGTVALSDVNGSPSAITRTERSSAHYFQRPDRREQGDGLFSARYDTTATSLRGYAAYARVGKDNGNWLWESQVNLRSPGFEVNDLAFLNRSDYTWMSANLARQWTVPKSVYRNVTAIVGAQQQFNFDGDRTDLQGQAFLSATFTNYWSFSTFFIHHPSVFDDEATRGGPVVKRDGYDFTSATLSTDGRRLAVLGATADYSSGTDDRDWGYDLSASVLLKPASNVSVSVAPALSVGRNLRQYVTAVADPTAADFFGQRYVFASIAQTTLSLETRLDLTLTPTLSLELYAQPLLASGRYFAFKQFDRPRELATSVFGRDVGTVDVARDASGAASSYTIDPDGPGPASAFTLGNPNFNLRSLRGNAVLRWEYRPGSTLFFVWTQSRSGDLSPSFGDFQLSRDAQALAALHPDNVFLIKANFWIGR